MGGFSKITKYINIEVIGFVFATCMMSWILFNAVWTPAPRKPVKNAVGSELV